MKLLRSMATLLCVLMIGCLHIVLGAESSGVMRVQQPKEFPFFNLNKEFLNDLKNMFNVSFFVETGTYKGDTTAVAAMVFDEVHTIELGQELYEKARERFANTSNVFLHQGNSPERLLELLQQLQQPAILWLDSHWSGADTAQGEENTPLLKELLSVQKSGLTDCIILVDDIRCYDPKCPYYSYGVHAGYPSLQEIKKAIKAINKDYKIKVIGDILIAYPKQYKIRSSKLVEACTKSRLDATEKGMEKLIDLEMNVIGGAEGAELQGIASLYEVFAKQGLSKDYALWWGLIKLKNQEYEAAYRAFELAQRCSMTHWRIHWYLAQASYSMGNAHKAREYTKYVIAKAPHFDQAKEFYNQITR